MRFKATITATVEYDAVPEHYGTDDVEKMLAIDKEAAEDDPLMFCNRDDAVWAVDVERLPDADSEKE